MRKWLFFALLSCICVVVDAQQTVVYSDQIVSLQTTINNNPLVPLIAHKGKRDVVCIDFDELSHDAHRYIYHITHCDARWEESQGIFESDYLSGFNDQPIEEYENSFNTTQIYTHYKVTFPNENTRLLLSGNYRVTVYDEDEPDDVLFTTEFCIAEPTMFVSGTVSSNTDIDFNDKHHQVSYNVSYGNCRVIDPAREIYTVVMQNRRNDNKVVNLSPNIRKAAGCEWTYRRELIFPAGNEYRKYELLDMNKPGLNVDKVRWDGDNYHTFIYPDVIDHNYTTDRDANGVRILRSTEGEDDVEGEYGWVHFTLPMEKPLAEDVYLTANWNQPFPNDAYRMEWDETEHCYSLTVFLKQGYYNYTYRTASGHNVMGDFYETENEYTILVYYCAQGSRYDRLVATCVMNTH